VWGLPRDTPLTVSDPQAAWVRSHVLSADEVYPVSIISADTGAQSARA
jgi:hypothetical protein